jgi:hypothetical protein
MPFGGEDSSSSEIHSILRPLMPPAALASSKAIVAPERFPVPKIAKGPVKLPRIPTLMAESETPGSSAKQAGPINSVTATAKTAAAEARQWNREELTLIRPLPFSIIGKIS